MRHAALFLVFTGCLHTTLARPISCLDLAPERPVEPRTTRSIAVAVFEDARGDEFSRWEDTPFVNLFHQSGQLDYPESVALIGGRAGGKRFVGTGSLDAGLAALLASSMRTMKLSPTVLDGESGADFVVSGKLVRSRMSMSAAPMVGALLGLFGVPFYRCACDLEFEIALYDAHAPEQPIFRRSYAFHDHKYGGLYYHNDALEVLFKRGLEQTLPQVVRDVAVAIAGRA